MLASVFWVLATVFVIIALALPRLRIVGVVGLVVLAALLGWGVLQRMRGAQPNEATDVRPRSRPSSPTAVEAFPLELLTASDLRLTGSGAPFELQGRLANESANLRLRSITIQATRRDCYEDALDPSGCVVAWQDRKWLPIEIPPQEAREFSIAMWMHGSAPRVRGERKDSFEIVTATAEPVELPVEKASP